MTTLYYKKPAILRESGVFNNHAVVEASAGTGKTYTLEHLVLELLINPPDQREINIEEILVVTFTEAATRELRERIRSLIRKVLEGGTEEPDRATLDHYWIIDAARAVRLREALFRFDGAAISTIHGFCQRVLAEQAFLGGRLFEEEHADGAELFGFVFRDLVRTALAEPGPTGEALRRWIETGFSLTKLENLLYLCHREGSPTRCPVTPAWEPKLLFTCIEKLEPVSALYNEGSKLLTGQGLKSLQGITTELEQALKQLRQYPGTVEANQALLQWASKSRSIEKIKKTQLEHLYRLAARQETAQSFTDKIAWLDQIITRAAGPESFFVYHFLPRIENKLAARKTSQGLLDFDDMLLGVLKALEGPGADTLLQALRNRWSYALVDEFQDTDPIQWKIFKKIFVNSKGLQRLIVIGDPKQAIYGFRGADIHTYDMAKKELLKKHGASRLPLIKNYRSTKAIIDAVNLILTVKDHQGNGFFSGLNRYEEEVICGAPDRCVTNPTGNPVIPVYLLHLYHDYEKLNKEAIDHGLACYIAREINNLLNGPEFLISSSSGHTPAPIQAGDIYVLTRTTAEGRRIGEVLRSYGIPHAYYKQEGLYQTREAANIHTLLGAIDKPYDLGQKMSAWLTPFFDLPLEQLQQWRDAGDNHPRAALLFDWRRLAERQEWAKLFDQLLTATGLTRRLVFRGDERALTNYLHLFELLLAETHSRPLTAGELARDLKARIDGRKKPEGREGEVQRLESDREAVQILTMHKAKGLEAEVVFIAGGFSNSTGGSDIKTSIYHVENRRHLHLGKATGKIASALQQEEAEENQRLLYVALTRAKSRIYLPYFGNSSRERETRQFGYNLKNSSYQVLQKQLQLLAEQDYFRRSNYFTLLEVNCNIQPGHQRIGGDRESDWLPANLLSLPPSRAEAAARLKINSKGVILTSYSRIKQGESWNPPQPGEEIHEELDNQETAGYASSGDSAAITDTSELPGGKDTGIFLHALLEETDPAELLNYSRKQWVNDDHVFQRASTMARQYGYPENYLPEALLLVYNALRTPLQVQAGNRQGQFVMPGGIASAEQFSREMSFIYPIPEETHPLLGKTGAEKVSSDQQPFQVKRGYLQGLIDLVFKYENHFYLLDWKSDRLPSYDSQYLAGHVDHNYSLQAVIYCLAVIRLLAIQNEVDYEKRFGGIIYLFLRGLCPISNNETGRTTNQGLWFIRPSFPQVKTWETELLQRQEWGA